MHRDVVVALIGNPLAWMAGLPWGIIASAFTALYFLTKWIRELVDWYREVKRNERSDKWGEPE
jgi:hypothetical protein